MAESVTSPKMRVDSWAAPLSEGQRWEVYYRMQRGRWTEVAEWLGKDIGIEPPSRTALYEFTKRMRSGAQAHRIENGVLAASEAGELARNAKVNNEDLTEALRAMAADEAMRTGNSASAKEWLEMSLALADERLKTLEIDLKNRAQQTKDKQLRLAREKFEAAETRATVAEKRADAAEARATALQARITELETALQDAGKINAADPAKVVEEVDRILGRKKS